MWHDRISGHCNIITSIYNNYTSCKKPPTLCPDMHRFLLLLVYVQIAVHHGDHNSDSTCNFATNSCQITMMTTTAASPNRDEHHPRAGPKSRMLVNDPCKYMDRKHTATMLISVRAACVAPEVNLRITQVRKQARKGYTLALKPRANVTKRTCVLQKSLSMANDLETQHLVMFNINMIDFKNNFWHCRLCLVEQARKPQFMELRTYPLEYLKSLTKVVKKRNLKINGLMRNHDAGWS